MARQKKQPQPAEVNQQPQPAEVEDGLIAIQKDGEQLRIHPTTLEAHKNAGWQFVE